RTVEVERALERDGMTHELPEQRQEERNIVDEASSCIIEIHARNRNLGGAHGFTRSSIAVTTLQGRTRDCDPFLWPGATPRLRAGACPADHPCFRWAPCLPWSPIRC